MHKIINDELFKNSFLNNDLQKKKKNNNLKILILIAICISLIISIVLIIKRSQKSNLVTEESSGTEESEDISLKKIYNETIDELKKIKVNIIKGKGNYKLGFDNTYNNLISLEKTITVYAEWKVKNWGYAEKIESIYSNDIIVGYEIISKKKNNGNWKIKENPLLTNKMIINFKSDRYEDINFTIRVYTMKKPE